MEVGARVQVKHLGDCGTIRYLGPVHYAKGDWAGVEMDTKCGKNDGSVKGKRYFDCEEQHGVFAKLTDVSILSSSSSTPSASPPVQHLQEQENPQAAELKRQGNELFVAKRFQEAMTLYTQAIQLEPSNHILFGNRAACLLELDKPEEALSDTDRAIKLNPEWWKGHARHGKVLMALGDNESALDAFLQAIELVDDERHRVELEALADQCEDRIREEEGTFDMMGMDWLESLPPELQQAAMQDPMFREMLQAELMQQGLSGAIPFSQAPPDAPFNMDGFDGTQGGIQKQRLKKVVVRELPLHLAIRECKGDLNAFQNVLRKEAVESDFSVDELDDFGKTALAWACQYGYIDIVRMLLEHGASVNPVQRTTVDEEEGGNDTDKDEDIAIPLFFAVKSGRTDVVDLLLEHNADAWIQEPILGHSIMHQAVKSGDLAMIRHLVGKLGSKILSIEDFRGLSAVSLACKIRLEDESARSEMLTFMLESCGSVHADVLFTALSCDDGGKMLAFLQAQCPSTKINADPPVRTASGATLIHLAAGVRNEEESLRLLRLLFNEGLTDLVNAVDHQNFTPLGYACRGSRVHGQVVDLLAKHGGDVNAAQGPGQTTLLHMVGDESNEPVWQQLIALGADESKLDREGNAPKLRPNFGDKCSIM